MERVTRYRDETLKRLVTDKDRLSHLDRLYQMSNRSNPAAIIKACLSSLVDAKESVDWGDLSLDIEDIGSRKSAYMSSMSMEFISWISEELLIYEGPL